ncbi:hypothetical protein [Crinalium epipsammum]|nr:hypothetical protein [Crinalium epipsammum]
MKNYTFGKCLDVTVSHFPIKLGGNSGKARSRNIVSWVYKA